MKSRTLKLTGIITICLLMVFTLIGCKYSKSYAEKINKAYKDGKPLTVEQVKAGLGEPTSDSEENMIVWAQGYSKDDEEKFEKDLEDGKKVKVLFVYANEGKAIFAYYCEMTKDNKEDVAKDFLAEVIKNVDITKLQ